MTDNQDSAPVDTVQDGWIEWTGGPTPQGYGQRRTKNYESGVKSFDDDDWGSDIIAYRQSQTPPTDRPLTAGDALRPLDAPCSCFGDSGMQASTHHDADDNERCDLCGGLVSVTARPATSAASEVEWLHLGDPCIRCGIEHDDVPVGPCCGLDAAVRKVKEMAKWEREGHASIKIAPLNIILSAVCARTLSPEVQGLPSQNDYSPRKTLTNSALASPPVSERERELEGALERVRKGLDKAAELGVDRTLFGRSGPGLAMADIREIVAAVAGEDK